MGLLITEDPRRHVSVQLEFAPLFDATARRLPQHLEVSLLALPTPPPAITLNLKRPVRDGRVRGHWKLRVAIKEANSY